MSSSSSSTGRSRPGERAARFTRQLLAFSRQQVLSPRLIDPAETVDAMAPCCKHLLGEGVRLETRRLTRRRSREGRSRASSSRW